MRSSPLLALAPDQRMEALTSQFPPGTRSHFFTSIQPGEFERILRGIPHWWVHQWTNSMTDKDRDAWGVYSAKTTRKQDAEGDVLLNMRPHLTALLAESPYDMEELLALPRLLDDPVDAQGVRIYFHREAVDPESGFFERVYPIAELEKNLRGMQQWGAAPFVTLNAIAYGEPRWNFNARYPRVFSCDWDAKHEQYPPEDLLNLYPPDLFIKSGGGFHAYWRIPSEERQTLSMDDWRRTALALIRTLGGDPNATHGTQLMRLPGSVHMKNPQAPKKVRIIHRYEGPARAQVSKGLTDAFKLVLREEDALNAQPNQPVLEIDPSDHPGLARFLEELKDQGLQPRVRGRSWTYFCPCHEISSRVDGDMDDGTSPEYVPRRTSTPSGIVKVRADRSLWIFCGSTQRCGAGSSEILEALGLPKGLQWVECEGGNIFGSDYGKRFKANLIAKGEWNKSKAIANTGPGLLEQCSLPPIPPTKREDDDTHA